MQNKFKKYTNVKYKKMRLKMKLKMRLKSEIKK